MTRVARHLWRSFVGGVLGSAVGLALFSVAVERAEKRRRDEMTNVHYLGAER